MTARPSLASIAEAVARKPRKPRDGNAEARVQARNQRPVYSWVALELPLPPSVNALTFNRKGGRSKTESYDAWLIEAGVLLNQQKPGRIVGPYSLMAAFARPNKSSDLANREKALSDLLVKHGVIEDDRFAESISLRWDHLVPSGAVYVTLREYRQ
jgi:crossover junction endodeoxyribonuclease RusA